MKTLIVLLCALVHLVPGEEVKEGHNAVDRVQAVVTGDNKTETVFHKNFEHFRPVGSRDWNNLQGFSKQTNTPNENTSFILSSVNKQVHGIRKRKVRAIWKKVGLGNTTLEIATPFTAFSRFNGFSSSSDFSSPSGSFTSLSSKFSSQPSAFNLASSDFTLRSCRFTSSPSGFTSTSCDFTSPSSNFTPLSSDFISSSSSLTSSSSGLTLPSSDVTSSSSSFTSFSSGFTSTSSNFMSPPSDHVKLSGPGILNINEDGVKGIDILNLDTDGTKDIDTQNLEINGAKENTIKSLRKNGTQDTEILKKGSQDSIKDRSNFNFTAATSSTKHITTTTGHFIDPSPTEVDGTKVPILQLVFKADISKLARQGRNQVKGSDEKSNKASDGNTAPLEGIVPELRKNLLGISADVRLIEGNISTSNLNSKADPLTLALGGMEQFQAAEKSTTVRSARSTTSFEPEESTKTIEISFPGTEIISDEHDLRNINNLLNTLPDELELGETDIEILKALFELELLRGKQNEMDADIEKKLEKLDVLVRVKESEEGVSKDINSSQVISESFEEGDVIVEDEERIPKSFGLNNRNKLQDLNEVDEENVMTIDLFSNIQKQIATLLSERKEFIETFTAKINSELHIIKQTVTLLQQIVAFKIEQSEVLLGGISPILEILQNGSLSVFSLLSQFVQVLESLFALKGEFFRSFTSSSNGYREAGILERVKDFKLKTILPTKMRIMLNILNNSEELGQIIGMILECVGELLDSKKELVESVGKFVDDKLKFVSMLTGPGVELEDLIEAAKTGTLLQFLNVGPVKFKGSDLPARDLNGLVRDLLRKNNPRVPVLGVPLKELLVDHRSLGALAGYSRGRVVNSLLAARLKRFIRGSSGDLEVRQGEALLEVDTPPLRLGKRCKRELDIGGSRVVVWTRRSSKLHATAGITAHKGFPPSLDLLATSIMDTAIDWNTFFIASLGKNLFGRCFSKFSKILPLRVLASARSLLNVRVATTNVRLEKRHTTGQPVLPFPIPNFNLRAGFFSPHLVFNFHLHLDGKLINLDIKSLKVTGCQVKVMGLTLFSFCGLIEKFILDQVKLATKENFPLTSPQLFRKLEYAIKMKLGEEVAIPLVLSDSQDMSPAEKVVSKSRKLLDLNLRLINRLTSFNNDLNDVSSKGYIQ